MDAALEGLHARFHYESCRWSAISSARAGPFGCQLYRPEFCDGWSGACGARIDCHDFRRRLLFRYLDCRAGPLPGSLGTTSVTIRQSGGPDLTAPLFFVSPRQINFLVPSGLSTGTANLIVKDGGQTVGTAVLLIASTSPGLFSANADGRGVAAALAVRVGSCAPVSIDLGSETDQVVLEPFRIK